MSDFEHSEYTSDATLNQMAEAYLLDSDLREAVSDKDLTLMARWGYRENQLARAREVLLGTAPDALIAEKLKVSLYALGVESEIAGGNTHYKHFCSPELQHAAQRLLNSVLLAHPILMHPSIRVCAYGENQSGYCSVGQAIALSSRGRFPMLRDGIDAQSLRAWVLNPVVDEGLTYHTDRFDGQCDAVSFKTPAAIAFHTPHRPTWLLASLHGLSEAARVEGDRFHKFGQQLLPTSRDANADAKSANLYATCLLDAMGLESGAMCPELLSVAKLHRMKDWPLFLSKMEQLAPAFVFGRRNGAPVFGTISDRTRLLLDGLVESDFAPTRHEAAQLIASSISHSKLANLTTADVAEFLREMLDSGQNELDGDTFGQLGHQEPWLEAAKLVRRERSMRAAIAHASPDSAPPEQGQPPSRAPRSNL